MPAQLKFEMVAEAKELLTQAQSIVLADYRGLTVAEVTDLRNKLRERDVIFRVIKNRLVKIALEEAGLPIPEDYLKGPSAFAMSMADPVSGPKVLSDYAKDNDKLSIKCGIFEGSVLDLDGVKALATMPSREELLGRLLGDLKSPVTKTAVALKATVNKIAYALKAVAEKKEAA